MSSGRSGRPAYRPEGHSRKSWVGAVVCALALAALGPLPAGANPSTLQSDGTRISHSQPVSPAVFRGDVRSLSAEVSASRRALPSPRAWDEGPASGPRSLRKTPLPGATDSPQPANQETADPVPGPTVSFKGLDFNTWGSGWPPDTVGDVGPNHYIQAVNTSVGIFNKTGTQLAAFTFDTLWAGAGTGTACDDSNGGDPTVVYDQMSDRWFVADFAFTDPNTPPFYECIAVSQSGDPVSGGWYLYAIRTDDTSHPWFADYPKMGIWPDGLYMTANMFEGNTFKEVRVWAFNRGDMESGVAVRTVIVDLGTTSYFSLLPSNLRGALPPAGRENLLIAESQTLFAFHVWKFHVDYSGSGSTFTGPTNVSQTSYTVASSTVPSPGNSLDSLRERLMMQAQYRNIGGTESLWVNHTVKTSSGGVTGIQWAQINVTGGAISTTPVQQQIYGNVGGDGVHRWMGSLAVDKDGNMALGYSASSASLNPDIRYAGRLASDPLNTLPQTETTMLPGVTRGTQSGNCGGGPCIRWGDYSAMTVDPDDCTFWYTNEYYETTGLNWQTRIGSFQFPSCSGIPTPPALSISDVSKGEGNAGTTAFDFAVTRSGNITGSSSVNYATADGTATAPGDYASTSGSLTFNPDDPVETVTVNVVGDSSVEPNETFFVNLSGAAGATLSDSQGQGTILDDDAGPPPPPSLAVNDVSAAEGNAGTTAITFTVTRSGDTTGSSSVNYATADNTATTADGDYASAAGTLNFDTGDTFKTATVNVTGDTTVEPDETFFVNLSALANATLTDAQGQGTIQNDDSAPPPAPSANLRVRIADGPDPAKVGARLRYLLTVTNLGPDPTSSVTLTDRLTRSELFVKANPAQAGDSCSRSRRRITCDLGTLASGEMNQVKIVAIPTAVGPVANQASVTGSVFDPVAANDAASATTTVKLPACTQTASEPGATVVGTAKRDVLCGLAGDEILKGLGGNDVLIGRGGDDTLSGGDGFDVHFGAGGADHLKAADGRRRNDAVDGGPGSDTCQADTGDLKRNCP